ncbi:zinc finger, CCHC-type containing protein [Tanacetum coccineum]
MFKLNIVNDNIALAFMSTSKLNDSIIWHARLGHVHFKRMQDMSKDGFIPAFDIDTEKCFVMFSLLHTKDEALDKFLVFKTEVELQQGSQIKRFMTDRGGFLIKRTGLPIMNSGLKGNQPELPSVGLYGRLSMGTDQFKVDLTKEFLSSRFSMKDMGEADVILGIKIKHESNGIAIFPRDISFVVDKREVYSSNSRHFITGKQFNGWRGGVRGRAISWAFKKQTCITGLTMESEFVALAAAGKEAEWLKNYSLRFHCGLNL